MIPTWVDGTLMPVGKLEAHLKGLRHKAISVFVICDGEVLIQQRAAGKYHTPNLWANTCCTHPAWGEDPKVCSIRRLNEELGMTRFGWKIWNIARMWAVEWSNMRLLTFL